LRRYRSIENGVELLEGNRSTFIRADGSSSLWRDFRAWQALGNVPEPALPRPYAFEAGRTRNLFIVGAGGFGREVYSMTRTSRGSDVQWRVVGFLNDIANALDQFEGFPPILAGTDYAPRENDAFICAIGDVKGRRAVCEKLRGKGAEFINLVSDAALISGAAILGAGIIIEAFTEIKDYSTILAHTTIGHDVKIGSCVQISPYCDIHGWAEIGDGCLIGSHAVILKNVKVGEGATVGAGSVVIQDVPPGATVFGVPAKQIC